MLNFYINKTFFKNNYPLIISSKKATPQLKHLRVIFGVKKKLVLLQIGYLYSRKSEEKIQKVVEQ